MSLTQVFDIMQSESLLNTIAFALPLSGIALGWWSFRWAEEGATPDSYGEAAFGFGRQYVKLHMGQRYRARCCARVCFNAGALLLAASVPMGAAANHARDHFNFSALSALFVVGLAAIYGASQAVDLWRNRRCDAFNIYFDKDMFFLYDRKLTERIYFRLNPMPVWSVADRNWFAKRKLPSIGEVYATASKEPGLADS